MKRKRTESDGIQQFKEFQSGRKRFCLTVNMLDEIDIPQPKETLHSEISQCIENVKEQKSDNGEDNELSEYEKLRMENMRRNQEMLASLNIGTAASLNMKKTNVPKPRPKLPRKNIEPVRRSLRITRKLAEPIRQSSNTIMQASVPKHSGPVHAIASNIEQADSETFFKSLAYLGKNTNSVKITTTDDSLEMSCIERYKERISNLRIQADHVRKVLPSRITAMAVHPSCDKTIICAGDRFGNVGFWDVNANSNDLFLYRPHQSGVRSICFYPPKSNELMSCSYDGTLRRTDFNTCVFNQVYASDHSSITCFSYPYNSRDTFLLALNDGHVATLDTRKSKRKSTSHVCHTKSLKCISCSAANEYLFCTCSTDASVAIWDLRMIRGIKSKLDSYEQYGRSVSSSYFSPVDGKYILTTSWDDRIKVLKLTASSKLKVKQTFRHSNQTGRWLSVFKAAWDPRNGRGIVIGSMLQNRRVQFYHAEQKRKKPILELYDENFNSITSTNVFHSNLNILASGNSSGKVFLWSD